MIGFVHIPKTGGSTVKFVLRNTFGVRHCDARSVTEGARLRPADLALARWLHPGLRSIGGHALIHPTATLKGVRFFTILRDPVRRVASAYAHHVRGRRIRSRGEPLLSLEEFVARERPGGAQTFQISGGSDAGEALRILREEYFAVGLLERLDESMAVIAALSPYPLDLRTGHLNAAPEGDTVKAEILADPERIAVIERANVADRILYDEVRDRLYPELLARARERAGLAFARRPEGEPGRIRAQLSRTWSRCVYRSALKVGHAFRRKKRRAVAAAGVVPPPVALPGAPTTTP